MRRTFWLALPLSGLFALPALAEEPTARDWAKAAKPAFEIGSTGPAVFIFGENQGCLDDEGTRACAVFAEGRRFMTHEGSLTPAVIMDILAKLPVGAMIELHGDIPDDRPDLVIGIFALALPVPHANGRENACRHA